MVLALLAQGGAGEGAGGAVFCVQEEQEPALEEGWQEQESASMEQVFTYGILFMLVFTYGILFMLESNFIALSEASQHGRIS